MPVIEVLMGRESIGPHPRRCLVNPGLPEEVQIKVIIITTTTTTTPRLRYLCLDRKQLPLWMLLRMRTTTTKRAVTKAVATAGAVVTKVVAIARATIKAVVAAIRVAVIRAAVKRAARAVFFVGVYPVL